MMNYSEIYDLAKEFEEELADKGVEWVIRFNLLTDPTVRLDSSYTIEDLEKIIDKLKIIKYQLDELQKEGYEIR